MQLLKHLVKRHKIIAFAANLHQIAPNVHIGMSPQASACVCSNALALLMNTSIRTLASASALRMSPALIKAAKITTGAQPTANANASPTQSSVYQLHSPTPCGVPSIANVSASKKVWAGVRTTEILFLHPKACTSMKILAHARSLKLVAL